MVFGGDEREKDADGVGGGEEVDEEEVVLMALVGVVAHKNTLRW